MTAPPWPSFGIRATALMIGSSANESSQARKNSSRTSPKNENSDPANWMTTNASATAPSTRTASRRRRWRSVSGTWGMGTAYDDPFTRRIACRGCPLRLSREQHRHRGGEAVRRREVRPPVLVEVGRGDVDRSASGPGCVGTTGQAAGAGDEDVGVVVERRRDEQVEVAVPIEVVERGRVGRIA